MTCISLSPFIQNKEVTCSRPSSKGVAEAGCKPTSYPNIHADNSCTTRPQETGSGKDPSPDRQRPRGQSMSGLPESPRHSEQPAASQVRGGCPPALRWSFLLHDSLTVPCPHTWLPLRAQQDGVRIWGNFPRSPGS